jgi:hypothetical protein
MASRGDSAGRRSVSDQQPPQGRSIFVRQAGHRSGLLVGFLIAGFGVGIAYRSLFNAPAEATLANFARSGIHGAGVGLTVWLIQVGFVSIARSRGLRWLTRNWLTTDLPRLVLIG